MITKKSFGRSVAFIAVMLTLSGEAKAVAVVDPATTIAVTTTGATTAGAIASLPQQLILGAEANGTSLGLIIVAGFANLHSMLEQSFTAQATQNAETQTKAAKIANQNNVALLNTATINNQTPAVATCVTATMAAISAASSAGNLASVSALNTSLAHRNSLGGRGAGGAVSAGTTVEEHKAYCDIVTDKSCGTSVKPALQDADKKAETILYGAGNGASAINILTYTPEQSTAADIAMNHMLTGAETPRVLSKAEADTPSGIEYQAKKIEYDLLMSAAMMPTTEVLASRKPLSGSSADTQALRNNIDPNGHAGQWVTAELDKIRANVGDDTISSADLLRIEIGRRVNNPGWMQDIQAINNTTSLMRELVFMQALSLKMQYNTYRAGESMALVQSAQASSAIRMRMMPELQALENSATATAQPVAASAAK